MKPRVVASIEARMKSSRLPGKMLMDVHGKPALTRLHERLLGASLVDDIVLATTIDSSDDPLEEWARRADVTIYRGSEKDVLLRVVEAQRRMNSDIIVEVTGDCTLLDPEVIDFGVAMFLANTSDVVSNTVKPSFPQGVDVQVFRRALLEEVERDIHDAAVREHVSLHFYENPERYRILHLVAPLRYHGPERRFQLDYPEDHRFLCEVYALMESTRGQLSHTRVFGTPEILDMLARHPEVAEINRHCVEKAVR